MMVTGPATARALMALTLLLAAPATSEPAHGQDRGSDSVPRSSPPLRRATEPVKDYVIASGALREGRLLGCAGASCTIGGVSVPIAQTVFIGLGVATASPPQLPDYTQDQIVLHDGSTQRGRMIGINDSSVVTDRGSRKRKDVAWIYLVPKPDQAKQPARFGAPQNRPATNEPPARQQTDRGGRDGGSTAPTPGPPRACASGRRWTGTMQAVHQPGGEHRVTTEVRVVLCEKPYPPPRPVKGVIDAIVLEDAGSIVTRRHWTDPNWTANPCRYSGQGTSAAVSPVGEISRTLEDVGRRGELRWSAPTYHVSLGPLKSLAYTEVCTDAYGTHTRSYEGGEGAWSVNSGPQRQLPLDGGRMIGSYRDGPVDVVSWSICRDGVACPPPPEPGRVASSDPPDCPGPTQEAAFLELALDQQKLSSNRLAAKSDEMLRLQNQARQYKSDFELAINTCNRISDLQTLLGLLMGQGPENVKTFTDSLGMVQKILDGDPTFLFSNTEYFDERLNLEQKWDTLMYAAGKVSPDSSSARDQLMGCAGSNLDAVFEDALKFVQLTEQIEPLLPQISKLLNDMRAMDNKIQQLWDKYYSACLRYAQCKKLPPSYCERLPGAR